VHQHTLTLRGERKHEAEVTQDKYHRVVDQEKVQATFKDGVLELHLPKSEAAKPKRIAING
jgi:HSP20 family protein